MTSSIYGWKTDIDEDRHTDYIEFAGVQIYNLEQFKAWVDKVFSGEITYNKELLLQDSKTILGNDKAEKLFGDFIDSNKDEDTRLQLFIELYYSFPSNINSTQNTKTILKTKTQINKAISNNIDKYYEKFLKRYKKNLESSQTLFLPSADERFENYSLIINNIANQRIRTTKEEISYNNDFNNIVVSQEPETDKLQYYVKPMIKNILQLKQNITTNFSNMSLISTHGISSTNFFKVPNNLIICILTPLNRLGAYNNDFISLIINKIKYLNFRNKFLQNPSCYLRDTKNSFLEYATCFYPGQMCNDLELSYNTKNPESSTLRGYYDSNFIDRTSTIINSTLGTGTQQYVTYLSDFIIHKNINGVLFVTCCRSCDLDVSLINETSKIYIYEKFINILNKTIDNLDDSEYNRCNLLLKNKNNTRDSNKASYYKAGNLPQALINQNPTLLKPIKDLGNTIRGDLQSNLTIRNKRNKALSPQSNKTRKLLLQYYTDFFVNSDNRDHILNIITAIDTNKNQFDKLNKLLYLNETELNSDEFDCLISNFTLIMNNNPVSAINYLFSYIYYNFNNPNSTVDPNHYNIIAQFFYNILYNMGTGTPIRIPITELHLSGDILPAEFKIDMSLDINSLLTTIKILDISGNKRLRSITPFTTNCKNLTTIKANDCNIYFLNKNILDLIDLNDINLDNNPNLSFNNLATSKVLYTPTDMEYLLTLTQQEQAEHLIYDDSFKSHPKFIIFFRYLLDYIVARRPLVEVVGNNNTEFGEIVYDKHAKNTNTRTSKNRNRNRNSGKKRTSRNRRSTNRNSNGNGNGNSNSGLSSGNNEYDRRAAMGWT